MKNNRIGILGGGQLGRMLAQEASELDLDIHFLDKDVSYPVPRMFPNFSKGDFTDHDDVIAFGQDKDILSIEIENVSVSALEQLEENGKKVYPQSSVISTIQDKGLQKLFYEKHEIPTADFKLVENKAEVLSLAKDGEWSLPFIQKARKGGYDGKGVQLIKSSEELEEAFDTPSVIEKKIDIDKELAIIIARNVDGEISLFPVNEMVFNQDGNLLDHLISPAEIDEAVEQKCADIGQKIVEKLNLIGILAIEFFLTKSGDVIVNEVAPRPHNSGHYTMNACNYSQYNLLLRTLLSMPLPQILQYRPALMLNILGPKEGSGEYSIEGLDKILEIEGVYPHMYGKLESRPLRKLGHINVLGENKEELINKMNTIKSNFKITV